ncbi:8133_t:CDS:2 [Diversispora eburnea]|uniref:8133_t:CDS:1 n=1 Tax=Diversispora eburnea TaxID=1213867 RepID=A0A9N9BYT3_9GLOM|nr:8133_t:CDS:2 [Diversispora eburnea]
MAAFENVSHIYDISVNKLANFNTTRGESDGLRKLVLLNNFVYTKFVVPEQLEQLSIPSQQRFDPLEELWLDDDDVKKDEENWLDACLDDSSYESIIETTESNKGKGFHPYWKDNSIISPRSQISLPSPSSHSPISPPSIESYRPFFDLNNNIPCLLDYHNQQQSSIPPSQIISSTKRSKDDFDILYSLTTSPRNLGNLDQGAIIDMFNMLDCI